MSSQETPTPSETRTAGKTQTVGVVGLGQMGWPMAAQLANAGFDVIVNDADPARTAAFVVEFKAGRSERLAELAASADFIITMLPNSAIVGAVLFGEGDNLADHLKPGSIVIEMSSGVPDATIGLSERLSAKDIGMIDAPVSGGVKRAKDGSLAIMVGGSDELVTPCLPVLEEMGTVLRVGKLGSGQAMKALNNLVSAGGFLIGVEALLVGKKFGLDPAIMVDVLNASTGSNNSTQKKFNQFVLSGRFDSGFGLDLMVKDLTIALGIAHGSGAAAPFAALCREMWSAAQSELGPGADHTELARLSERLAGTVLAPENSTDD